MTAKLTASGDIYDRLTVADVRGGDTVFRVGLGKGRGTWVNVATVHKTSNSPRPPRGEWLLVIYEDGVESFMLSVDPISIKRARAENHCPHCHEVLS